MAVKIGHASIDENGKIAGGSAGDQTGKEVCIRNYYMTSKGWYLLRPKEISIANAIAEAMKQACNNPYVGYDQGERLDIMTALKKYGTLEKIAEPTECDCSSLIRACIYQATGIDVGNFTTANEPTALKNSGLFENKISVTSSTVLYTGDILVTKTKGHTVAVVEGSSRSSASAASLSSDKKIDTVKEVQSWLNSIYNYGLAVDGICGAKTKKALIKAMQTHMGTEVDGIIGPKTKAVMKIHVLEKGSKGSLVKVLQAMLVCKGYPAAYVDGEFGSGTLSAVKAYQKSKWLTVDGEVGIKTWTKLCS